MIGTDVLFNKFDYNLTEEQQTFVKENHTKYSLSDLAKLTYKDNSLDERTVEVKNLKNFIIKQTRKHHSLELDSNQRAQIEKLSAKFSPVELTRKVFQDPTLAPLSKAAKTVDKYIKVMGLEPYKTADFKNSDDSYSPPKAISKLIAKVNTVKHDINLSEEKITNQQRKALESLRALLHNNRFLATINGITLPIERSLFEAEFINGVYDKTDLNSEEVNMYISLCSDYVLLKQIKEQMDMLNEELRSSVEDTDKGIKMTLTEAFGKKAKEYDDCAKRMKQLQESLSGMRSRRMDGIIQKNASLTLFVDLWKNEEDRKRMILIAKARESQLKGEMDHLESESEYVAKVLGISKNEILNN